MQKKSKALAFVIIICLFLTFFLKGCFVLFEYFYIGKTSAGKFTSTTASVEYTKAQNSKDGYASITLPDTGGGERDLKMLVLADPQVSRSPKYTVVGGCNEKTYDFIKDLVVATKPDMVSIVGDLTMSFSRNQWQYLQNYAEIFERTNTLWTFCFGNHDSEHEYVNAFSNTTKLKGQMTKNKIRKALSKYPHCLIDPNNSNYVINVKDNNGNYVRSLVYFDCQYDDKNEYYRYITEKQLQWYTKEINKISRLAYGENSENVVPSSVFMHVVPAEYLQSALKLCNNYNTNGIVYHYGKVLSGLYLEDNSHYYEYTLSEEDAFNTFLKVGSTDSVYFGHLHDNDMSLTYKGIRLTSVQHSGFSHSYRVSCDDNIADFRKIFEYGDDRGGTMLTISPNGGFGQYQVFGREVLSNYDVDYAIDYFYYIRKLEADPAWTVMC